MAKNLQTQMGMIMIENEWRNSDSVGCTDGHYYKLVRAANGRLCLISVADDGWPNPSQRELDENFESYGVEVSTTAFDNFDHICTFAREVGTLLECDPVVIIRSMCN